MGRLAKKASDKKISGTERADRVRKTRRSDVPDSIDGGPAIQLDDFGTKVYDDLQKYLSGNGILFNVDNILITQYAYFAQIFRIVANQMGTEYTSIVCVSDKGNEYMSVSYQVMSNAKNQMDSLSKILGIGPFYRQAIKAFDEEPEQEDEVADMIEEMNAYR